MDAIQYRIPDLLTEKNRLQVFVEILGNSSKPTTMLDDVASSLDDFTQRHGGILFVVKCKNTSNFKNKLIQLSSVREKSNLSNI